MGRKFYNDLAKMLGRFRDDCKAFVQQRRVEASQLESDITNAAAMASLNISQNQRRLSHQQHVNHPPPYRESQNPAQFQFQSQAIPQPQLQTRHEEPLTAPQPTRATVAPPVATTGVWSPDVGIRFSNAAASSQGPGLGRSQAQETWDPNRGIRFSWLFLRISPKEIYSSTQSICLYVHWKLEFGSSLSFSAWRNRILSG